jgi:hypothetical protein
VLDASHLNSVRESRQLRNFNFVLDALDPGCVPRRHLFSLDLFVS